jgi:4-amino-4-deoxy-L-arabinose transferase-like glycosyltransferase
MPVVQKFISGRLQQGASSRSSPGYTRYSPILFPLAVFLFALGARFIGIDWHGAHADEHPSAAAKVLAGQLVDDFQYYPPLLNYCTAILFVGYFVFGKIAGYWASAEDFRVAFFADRAPFYVLLRVVTATWAALVVPLVYWLALRLGQSRWSAVVAGTAAALIPASIYFSHIGKSDNGLASAFLLVCLAALRLIDEPDNVWRRIALGASIAFALSVKHSALFLLGPAAVLVLLELIRSDVRGRELGVLLAVVAAATIASWLPMNIGIALDPVGFFEAQVVQSQMSSRDASWATTLALFVEVVTAEGGVPALILILWIAAPLAIATIEDQAQRFRFWLLWLPTAIAFVAVAAIAGDRQPIYLWLPHIVLMSVTVVLLLTVGAGWKLPRSAV